MCAIAGYYYYAAYLFDTATEGVLQERCNKSELLIKVIAADGTLTLSEL